MNETIPQTSPAIGAEQVINIGAAPAERAPSWGMPKVELPVEEENKPAVDLDKLPETNTEPETGKTPDDTTLKAPEPKADDKPEVKPEAVPEKSVFELLGIENNEYNQKLVDSLKAGKLIEYVDFNRTDYSKMSPVELLREQVKSDNPGASERLIKSLFEDELGKYDLDSLDPDDKEVAEEKLALRMNRFRDTKIADQKAYAPPLIPDANNIAQQLQQNAAQAHQKQIESVITGVKADPFYQAIQGDRKMKLGEGKDAMNYELDPKVDIDRSITTNDVWDSMWVEKDGKKAFNTSKWAKVLAVANDPQYEQKLINHGKNLGKKEFDDEYTNPKASITVTGDPGASSTTKKGWRVA